MSKKSKSCATCFRSAAMPRFTSRKGVKRQCRHTGAMVTIAPKPDPACAGWQARPADAAIARKANEAANHRISQVKGKE